MKNQLQVIHEQSMLGQVLQVYNNLDNPLFLAKDVAAWIEHNNITHMMNIVDDDEKLTYTIRNSGQNREMWFLTEDGLYEVLMQSRKPIAKAFKKQVKGILKEIRKNGAYVHEEDGDDETVLMAKALIAANRAIERQKLKNQALEEQIQADSPYTQFGRVVATADAAINIGVFAKIIYNKHGIDIGRNKLIAWLRDEGYLIKNGAEKNLPKQRYVEQGLFKVKPSVVMRTAGAIEAGTTLVTGKGQVYFTNLLLKGRGIAQ